jgi:hypothetical protein
MTVSTKVCYGRLSFALFASNLSNVFLDMPSLDANSDSMVGRGNERNSEFTREANRKGWAA